MLSTIREKTQGIIATFILLLIVIPFALWGINSYFESGSKLNVATVNGTDISQVSYRRALDQLRGRVDPATLDSREFKQTILDSLIDQTLLVQDAEGQGYRVSNARLAQTIRTLPYFQRDGQFDSAMYDAVLRNQGMTSQEFEKRLREQSITGQIQTGLSDSVIVTNADVAQLARLLSQQREVAYAVINLEALMAKASINDKEIERYYTDHTELFQTPEQVRIEYLRLSPADLDQDYQPTEDDLKKAYADEASRYVVPALRRASHILITLPAGANEAQAKAALTKIEDIAKQARTTGADFAALAKKYSQDSATAAQGGDLGVVRPGVLPKELESAVFAMNKPGEISQPVRTSFGYHLIKLTAYAPEKRRPFAEVRKDLVQLVRQRKGEEKFLDVSEKFRNLVYEQPDSLAPAAKALGLKVEKSDWFARAGGSGMAANPKVVQAAFAPDVLSQARNSDAIDIDDNTLVAVRVAERKPAARQPLNEVRAQIEGILKQEQARQEARRLGDSWLGELRTGSALDALAKQSSFQYEPPKMLTRNQKAGVDPRIVEAVFRAPRPVGGKPVYDLVDLDKQGYAVFALKQVVEPSGKTEDNAQNEAKRILTSHRGADYYADYRAGLREKAKIKIFADQL